jgi:hypothetical protein
MCPSGAKEALKSTVKLKYCHTGYADCLLPSSQHNLYDIYLLLCVQCWTPDDGQRNCPKHVELYSKNKFEKLVHLVTFIIRIGIERSASSLIWFTPEEDQLVVTVRSLVTVWILSGNTNISCASRTTKYSSTVIQPVV